MHSGQVSLKEGSVVIGREVDGARPKKKKTSDKLRFLPDLRENVGGMRESRCDNSQRNTQETGKARKSKRLKRASLTWSFLPSEIYFFHLVPYFFLFYKVTRGIYGLFIPSRETDQENVLNLVFRK